jgi:hypothetical protein
MITRRKFLASIVPGLVALSGGLTYWGYRTGSCPLSSEAYCVGPCGAFVSSSGDGVCDRIARREAQAVSQQPEAQTSPTRLSNPTSQPTATTQATPPATSAVQRASATPSARPTTLPTAKPTALQPRVAVACPYGLVNDRYPGRCRRYVDRNGNKICDLSEPQSNS